MINTLIILIVYAVIALGVVSLVMMLLEQVRRYGATEKMAHADIALFKAKTDLTLQQNNHLQTERELSWNNFRKFEIVKKFMEAEDMCSFYLKPYDGQPLPSFKPGQYLTFQLNIPGQKKPVIRCYSLSDTAVNPEHYRLTIKKVPPPRDQPDIPPGLSSNYFHDVLQEKDIIDVKAPSGNFYFDMSRPHPAVFIGGGVGLTPVLSMVNSLVDTGYDTETWFFYGVRNQADHAMREHLEKLDAEHDWLRLRICYSGPNDDSPAASESLVYGRVSVELFKQVLPSNNYDFYMCGPPPMMNSVVKDLGDWGVPDERVHFEAFGPASVKRVKDASKEDSDKSDSVELEVHFAKSNKKVKWDGSCDSILELAEENDVTMEFGCRAGNCGSCITVVKDGTTKQVQEAGADCDKGSCLSCISIPNSNLVLDA